MKKSVAVLGLGKYGSSLSENMYRLGADVLAVDCSEELISDFTGRCTSAVCANLSNEEEVASLGLKKGDKITIIGYRGSYGDKIEVVYAYYVSKQ